MVHNASIEAHNVAADYYLVFNNELKRFADPLWCKSQLASSYVHVNSRVKWVDMLGPEEKYRDFSDEESQASGNENEGEGENETIYAGVFWSPEEKEVFFHHLSRSSIHRLEEWAKYLPQKSKFEILTYFQVLSRNLRDLKRLNSKRHGGILTKKEFPIAYEMDEFFTDLEEDMSRKADQKLSILQEPDSQPSCAQNPDYVQMQGNQNMDATALISVENWSKRWNPIYSKTRAPELSPASKIALPFSQESLDFATVCVKSYLRKVLWFTVLPNLDTKHVARHKLSNEDFFANDVVDENEGELMVEGDSKSLFPHVVTKEDVWKGLAVMRQEGLAAPTLAETVLATLKKFELKHEEGRLFKSSQVAMGIIPRILAHAEVAHDLDSFARSAKSQKKDVDQECENDLNHIHQKLFRINGKKTGVDRFVVDDEFDLLENPLEEALCDIETRTLEEHDVQSSRLYQHMLLTFLQGEAGVWEALDVDLPEKATEASIIPEPIQREFQYQ
ncbi:LANO_0H05292g1_1 [Lachancea nothofagi CBS 11611]|uniref:LANO_0H05292g1_1 n=1 Tax=Lachancea nothofagi CBS 11611 TaxID=1266666 RepID=A0A1G4KLB9_9SACH|nr:LANO_0H05292g1_1 [Lachancea nothofagi CBS 11611]